LGDILTGRCDFAEKQRTTYPCLFVMYWDFPRLARNGIILRFCWRGLSPLKGTMAH